MFVTCFFLHEVGTLQKNCTDQYCMKFPNSHGRQTEPPGIFSHPIHSARHNRASSKKKVQRLPMVHKRMGPFCLGHQQYLCIPSCKVTLVYACGHVQHLEVFPFCINISCLSLSDAPPSYDSLYGQMKAAKAESSGFVAFMKKVVIIILGTSELLSVQSLYLQCNILK